MWDLNILLLRKKLTVKGFCLIIWHHARVVVYGRNVSQPSFSVSVGMFSFIQYIGVIHLVSMSLPEGIAQHIVVHLMYQWPKGGGSYVAILSFPLSFN